MSESERNHQSDSEMSGLVTRFEDMIKLDEAYFFDVEEFEEIIEYYLLRNNLKKAIKAVRFAVSQHPQSLALKLRKSQVYASTGRLNDALELLGQVEQVDQYNEEIFLTKATIYSQLRNHDEAIKYYKLAIEHSENDVDDLYLDLALEHENSEEFDEAIEALHTALKINPENEASLYELAYCYDLTGKVDESVVYYKTFIDAHPYSFTAWYNLGNSYNKLDDYEKALEAFDFCLVIKESFASAYFNKANALVQLERFEDAIETYKQTFEYEEEHGITFSYIGECYEKMERYDDALKAYEQAIDVDETLADAWLGVGIVKDCLGKLEEGIQYIRKALSIEEDNGSYWYIYGEALEKLGKHDEAMKAYAHSATLDSDNPQMWLEFSNLMCELDSPKSAASVISEGITHLPDEAVLKYRLVAYHLKGGRVNQALAVLEDALQQNYEAHSNLFEYFPDAKLVSVIIDLVELYKEQK
jgi:tetratricopeptide (TPR) repeat protein